MLEGGSQLAGYLHEAQPLWVVPYGALVQGLCHMRKSCPRNTCMAGLLFSLPHPA